MSKLNIAIADDNEWTLQLFEEIVKSDHDLNIVGSARDGEGILSVIEEKEPDVVLLDIVMPKMDGLEVMERVRNNGRRKKPAFIVISSVGKTSITVDAFACGADYFLMKPIDTEVVLKRIRPDAFRPVLLSASS